MTHANQPSGVSTDDVKALEKLPGLGFFEDDIQAQLTETAKSISQDIVDLLSQQYKEARAIRTIPEGLWKPLRGKSYLIAAQHCEDLATNLREASKNPNTKL